MAFFIGNASNNGTASADLTVTLPGGIAQNDLIVAAYSTGHTSDQNLGTVTAGYTETADLFANDTTDTNLWSGYKLMGATPDSNVVFDNVTADANVGMAGVVEVLRDVDTTTPIDATTTTATGTNGPTPNPPSITTVTVGAWVIAIGGSSEPDVPTAPTNYGNLAEDQNAATSPTNCMIATRAMTAPAAEDPGTFGGISGSGADCWCAVTMAIRPIVLPAPLNLASNFISMSPRDLPSVRPFEWPNLLVTTLGVQPAPITPADLQSISWHRQVVGDMPQNLLPLQISLGANLRPRQPILVSQRPLQQFNIFEVPNLLTSTLSAPAALPLNVVSDLVHQPEQKLPAVEIPNLLTSTLQEAASHGPFVPQALQSIQPDFQLIPDIKVNLLTSTLTVIEEKPFANNFEGIKYQIPVPNTFETANLLLNTLNSKPFSNIFDASRWQSWKPVSFDNPNLLTTVLAPVGQKPFMSLDLQVPGYIYRPQQFDNPNLLTSTLFGAPVPRPFIPYDWHQTRYWLDTPKPFVWPNLLTTLFPKVLNLPIAQLLDPPQKYWILITTPQGQQVVAKPGNTIRVHASVSAAGGNISSTSVGSAMYLVCPRDGEWFAMSELGNWNMDGVPIP